MRCLDGPILASGTGATMRLPSSINVLSRAKTPSWSRTASPVPGRPWPAPPHPRANRRHPEMPACRRPAAAHSPSLGAICQNYSQAQDNRPRMAVVGLHGCRGLCRIGESDHRDPLPARTVAQARRIANGLPAALGAGRLAGKRMVHPSSRSSSSAIRFSRSSPRRIPYPGCLECWVRAHGSGSSSTRLQDSSQPMAPVSNAPQDAPRDSVTICTQAVITRYDARLRP
jgi:hypothetical protein